MIYKRIKATIINLYLIGGYLVSLDSEKNVSRVWTPVSIFELRQLQIIKKFGPKEECVFTKHGHVLE